MYLMNLFTNKWVIVFIYLFTAHTESQFVFPQDPISLPSYSAILPTSQTQNNDSCNLNYFLFDSIVEIDLIFSFLF